MTTTAIQVPLFDAKMVDWLGQEIHAGDTISYPTCRPDGSKTLVLAKVLLISAEYTTYTGLHSRMMVQPLGESRERAFPRAMHPVAITVFEAVTKVPEKAA